MPLELEFSDPYMELLESFGEPDEPIRTIENLSAVQSYHNKIVGHSALAPYGRSDLATISWDDINEQPKYTTPDGKEWAQIYIAYREKPAPEG